MTQRTGYAIGLNWYVRGYMSLEPGAHEPIEASMTFHTPRILFDERERFGVGTSETVLVTDHGTEIMSRLPGTLRLV
jgi:Xaa-Pro dipeptidase